MPAISSITRLAGIMPAPPILNRLIQLSRPGFLALALVLVPLVASRAAATEQSKPGWWREAVFYEIFVRSFADAKQGPLANDGIGDLQGLIDHLDYLNDGRGPAGSSLGVTALWLMPVSPSPSYHGYDVADYFAVNPQFGDAALFKRFIAEAHRHGIRVIVDFVLNHCSSDHPLFKAALAASSGSPARQMFRFAPLPDPLIGPWDQRVWHPGGGEFYYGVFSADMPDWNFRNPAVTEHHRRAAAFWLKEMDVDGFRLDAVRYFFESGEVMQDTDETREWLRGFTEFCHSIKPDAFVVTENTARSREIAQWVESGATDSSFEFDLTRATYEAIRFHTPAIFQHALETIRPMYHGDARWSSLLTNHDQERIVTQLGGNLEQARFAAKLLFTTPGVPFVYYGDELGLRGAKPDPELRTPMPWTAQPPNAGFTSPTTQPWHALTADFRTANVEKESADANSLLTLYRKLIRLNARSPALRHGAPNEIVASDNKVYAAMRSTDSEVVLVLANFSDAPVRDLKLSVQKAPQRQFAALTDEIAGAQIAGCEADSASTIRDWQPLPELSPLSVYVGRWKK
jgi:glycosidase